MPRQPPGHARVCRRHRPMCAGSAAICSTALNWRAGASSKVFSPGPVPASPPRWTRWNRSSPGISRRASDPAPPVRHTAPCHPTRNGSALPTMGWLGSASDGRQVPFSPRICGAYGPHPVIARRPAIAFAHAGSVRADGRAPLTCGTAVRCARTCRLTLAVSGDARIRRARSRATLSGCARSVGACGREASAGPRRGASPTVTVTVAFAALPDGAGIDCAGARLPRPAACGGRAIPMTRG